ncbi:MAG: hypothetical protein WDN28_13900 [Chthoniobacter sp.]
MALCDVDEKTLAKAAEKYPNAKLFRDFRKMLDEVKEIEAVTVSTPRPRALSGGHARHRGGQARVRAKAAGQYAVGSAGIAQGSEEEGRDHPDGQPGPLPTTTTAWSRSGSPPASSAR